MSRVQAAFLCLSNVIVDLSRLYRQNFPGNLKTESGIAVSLQRMRSQNVCVNVCTCTSAARCEPRLQNNGQGIHRHQYVT